MAQHLEPVTAWSALRTLLRVVVKGCQVCGGEHEGTLVELAERKVPINTATGKVIDWTAAWVASPAPSCAREAARLLGRKKPVEWVVTPLAVDEGRVFAVVDDAEQTNVTSRTREKVDAR